MTILKTTILKITGDHTMQTVPISKFKANALKFIAEIARNKESIIITKRNKPIVKIVPISDTEKQNIPGKLATSLVFEKDIISPLGEELWEVCQ